MKLVDALVALNYDIRWCVEQTFSDLVEWSEQAAKRAGN